MALKLAGGAAGQLLGGYELEVAWGLLAGERLATPVEDFDAVGQLALAEDDHGLYRLAPMRVRYAEHTRFLNGRMSAEDGLDLCGIDILAAGLDQVFLAVDESERAVLLTPQQVASMEPTALEHLSVGRIVIEIAGHDARAPHHAFALLADRHLVHVFVDDADLHQRRGSFAQRRHFAWAGTAVREQIARLALPEGVVKIDAEGLGQLRDDVRHHVGVAVGEAQARQIVGLPLRA